MEQWSQNKSFHGALRDGFVISHTSYRGLRFGFQHQQGGSQSSVAPISGDLTPSSEHPPPSTMHTHTCRQNSQTHKIKDMSLKII